MDFSGCYGQGTALGASGAVVDFTGAKFPGADLRGASLASLNLAGADLSDAFIGDACDWSNAVLDSANLSGAAAARGNFKGASMKGVTAHGASFVRAILDGATMTSGLFGSNQFLFAITSNVPDLEAELDSDQYVQPDLAALFLVQGYDLSSNPPVQVLVPASNWVIQDPAGPFSLIANAGNTAIDVFLTGSQQPAVFAGASMQGTSASGASFTAADLSGVSWTGTGADADHCDFASANFSGSLLSETDFTEASMNGANFNGAVLIQCKLRGCIIASGQDNRATSFNGAFLQGVDFTDATLSQALLAGAAVSLPQGVPLFVMPSSYATDLNTDGLPALTVYFSQEGWTLGQTTSIADVSAWSIDNSANTTAPLVATFSVVNQNSELMVFDASLGKYLFKLGQNMLPFLNQAAASPLLIAQFSQNGYTLAKAAPISGADFWQITNSNECPAASGVHV